MREKRRVPALSGPRAFEVLEQASWERRGEEK
jgi:hypothetical protein